MSLINKSVSQGYSDFSLDDVHKDEIDKHKNIPVVEEKIDKTRDSLL